MPDPGAQLTPEQSQALDTLEKALPTITNPVRRAIVIDKLKRYGRHVTEPAAKPQTIAEGAKPDMGDQSGVPSFVSYKDPASNTNIPLSEKVDLSAPAPGMTPSQELRHIATSYDTGKPNEPDTGMPPHAHSTPVRAAALALEPLAALSLGGLTGLTGGLAVPPLRVASNMLTEPISGGAMKTGGLEAGEAAAARMPYLSLPAELVGGLAEGSVPQRVAGPVAARASPALPPGSSLTARALTGLERSAAAGGALGMVSGSASAADQLLQGRPAGEALSAIPRETGLNAAGAVALAPLSHALTGFGAKATSALREGPMGADVIRLERAGLNTRPSVPPIQAEAKPSTKKLGLGISEVSTPEGNAVRAAQIRQGNKLGPEGGNQAEDIVGREAAQSAVGRLSAETKRLELKHARENTAYQATKEGRATVSSEPVARHVMDTIKSGTSIWGQPLPGNSREISAYRRELQTMIQGRVVPGDAGIPMAAAKELGINIIGRARTPPSPSMPGPSDAELPWGLPIPDVNLPEKSFSVVLEPLPMNAQQLEKSISNFSHMAGEASAAKKEGLAAAAERTAAVLRGMRSGFKPNAIAPETMKAKLSTGGEVSGYPALKQLHHEEYNKLEQQLQAFGLPANLRDIDPQNVNHLKAALGAIEGGDRELERITAGLGDPELDRKVRAAAATYAYNRLRGKAGKVRGVVTPSGPHLFGSVGDTIRLALDPLARRFGGYLVPEPQRSALAPARAAIAASSGVPEKVLSSFIDAIALDKKLGED